MAPYYLIHRLKENVLYSLEFFWKYIIIISSFKTWHYQTFLKHVTSERICQEFDLTTWLSHLQIEVQAAIARRVSVHASVQLWKWLTNRFAEWGMWAAYWIKVTFTNLLFLHYQASGKGCRRQMTSGANLSALVGVGRRCLVLVNFNFNWPEFALLFTLVKRSIHPVFFISNFFLSNKASKTSELSNLKASKFEIKTQYTITGVFIESIPFTFESTVIML